MCPTNLELKKSRSSCNPNVYETIEKRNNYRLLTPTALDLSCSCEIILLDCAMPNCAWVTSQKFGCKRLKLALAVCCMCRLSRFLTFTNIRTSYQISKVKFRHWQKERWEILHLFLIQRIAKTFLWIASLSNKEFKTSLQHNQLDWKQFHNKTTETFLQFPSPH